jgi:hypothetical protein
MVMHPSIMALKGDQLLVGTHYESVPTSTYQKK